MQTFPFTLDKNGKGNNPVTLSAYTGEPEEENHHVQGRQPAGAERHDHSAGRNLYAGPQEGDAGDALLPATVQVDNLVYVAMTFQINYAQAGNMGKGATGK